MVQKNWLPYILDSNEYKSPVKMFCVKIATCRPIVRVCLKGIMRYRGNFVEYSDVNFHIKGKVACCYTGS